MSATPADFSFHGNEEERIVQHSPKINIEAARKRHHEIRELEEVYGRKFLQKSLHEAGIRWRALTAPNAAEIFDGIQSSPQESASE